MIKYFYFQIIETLIEKIAKYKEVLKCYENYEECINDLIKKIPNLRCQAKKSKMFAYMSGFGFKNNIKAEDFDNVYLDELRNFLENIFK